MRNERGVAKALSDFLVACVSPETRRLIMGGMTSVPRPKRVGNGMAEEVA